VTLVARHTLAILLVVASLFMVALRFRPPLPVPPAPPAGALVLEGKFLGATAAQDAITISCLCAELADLLERDGAKDSPKIKNGVQVDELRVAAREARTRGASIGERQPQVRDAIRAYLDEKVGVSGGPISPEQRAKWVEAFLEIARAASHASGN
jgi:hypothetical protein